MFAYSRWAANGRGNIYHFLIPRQSHISSLDGKFNQILFRNHRRLFQGSQLYQEYLHWYKTVTPQHVYFSPFNTARSHGSQIAGSCELEPYCCSIFCCKKLFLISYIFSIHRVSKGLSVLLSCRRSVQRSICCFVVVGLSKGRSVLYCCSRSVQGLSVLLCCSSSVQDLSVFFFFCSRCVQMSISVVLL